MLVTLVGCNCSRSPITRIGNRDARAKVSSTRASYRAKVKPCGLSAVSTADWMICCTRMIPVTAAMVVDGPDTGLPQLRRAGDDRTATDGSWR